jgi:ATP-dependent DNA helicase DinG
MSDAPELRPIDRLISTRAQESLRAAIAEYDGAEIFFVGRVGESGMIESVEPCAFGNQSAVPVIERMARPGDVVLHNHPSGNLEPSQADISVASRFGNSGVGSYIIDNDAEAVRIIVPAMPPRDRKRLDVGALADVLGPEGPLARAMRDYEERPQQTEMLRTVADAFNNDGIAAIEAGTGVGKSLAYLIPAVYWSKTNDEKVVISTNTINLQEQLIAKDIPFLQKHLGFEFVAELMKGRANYLCLRKASFLRSQPDFFGDDQLVSQRDAILDWAEKTQSGNLSELAFVPDSDVWEEVSSDGDNCTRLQCAYYPKCHFFAARHRVAKADLVVVNHHLLMADLAVRRETQNYTSPAVLPAYKRVIFDEAHNVEDVATRYLGIRLTRRVLARLLNRLVHRERSNRGLLPYLHDQMIVASYKYPSPIVDQAAQRIAEQIIPLRRSLARAVADLMDRCSNGVCEALRMRPAPGRELQMRITSKIEEGRFWNAEVGPAIREVTEQMSQLVAGLRLVREALRQLPEDVRRSLDSPAGEMNGIARKLDGCSQEFRNFYSVGENRCRWIEVQAQRDGRDLAVRLISQPLNVRDDLHNSVYRTTPTVVMTSATLTVDRRFDYFLGRVGLSDLCEAAESDTLERVIPLQLHTPFDYARQAFVGVPVDLPEPGEEEFTSAAIEFLLPALHTSEGSAFLLFTSYKQMNTFHARLAPLLEPLGFACLKQGGENRHALLERFRNDRTSILFATSSFWEGVDVPGDALRMLVLVKLPFRVPTDPLQCARVEELESMGVDSFTDYVVPQAVIKFKQGFGRLIRKRDDTGAVLILDRRVVTKRYGRMFLNSLPTETIHQNTSLELLEDLQRFFGR